MQNYIFDALMEAGAPFGIKPFGIRAMDSMRLEKSYKLVGRELSIEYAALESGSSASSISTRVRSLAVTRWSPGRQGFREQARHAGGPWRDGRRRARLRAGDKRRRDVGRTTSGGYGWRTGKSLALAMVRPEFARGTELDVRVLGETRRAASSPTAPMTRRTRRCGNSRRLEYWAA